MTIPSFLFSIITTSVANWATARFTSVVSGISAIGVALEIGLALFFGYRAVAVSSRSARPAAGKPLRIRPGCPVYNSQFGSWIIFDSEERL